jgi:release factor glutamine methyltransferase
MRPDRGVPAAGGKTLAKLHREARLSLEAAGVGTPELDARLLVQHVSGTSATDRAARPEMAVDGRVAAAVEAALRRRIGGEPVHRILGFREFYGLRLKLSPETLEPRPDTEILVDALLPFVRRVAAFEGSCSILDLGTGSGAIALALLAQVPDSIATGVDVSQESVATARDNARALGLAARFTAVQCDWFEKISCRYHAIASNPPYIPSDELSTLPREVRYFDPARALDGGADGLEAYRTIAGRAHAHLEPGGVIAVEIGASQKPEVEGMFIAAGYGLQDARRDLAGRDRVLVFRRR